MHTRDIRKKYLNFYKKLNHAVVPSASLVPENDSTTLFTGSGMQPMVPYLLGEKHPLGTRIVDSQKSFRAGDIDEVGDNRHTTFFEMLGNWSLGDYFKKEQLPWIFSFLVDEVGLDPKHLYVTVFGGDDANGLPRDEVSPKIWQELFKKKDIKAQIVDIGTEADGARKGMQEGRIFYYGAEKNWWSRAGVPKNMPVGEPGGADSEIFYEFVEVSHDEMFGVHCHPNCDCGRFLEIGNNVFMEYVKEEDGTFSQLENKNVDFGGGLERITMAAQNNPDIFLTNHSYLLKHLSKLSGKKYELDKETTKAFRVIADHIKAAVFLIGDGVLPGNSEQGYVLRRLLRRAIRFADMVGIEEGVLQSLVTSVVEAYEDIYTELNIKNSQQVIAEEEKQFRKTLQAGMHELEKIQGSITGTDAFRLFTTYGFPVELTQEIASERGSSVDLVAFEEEMKKHKEKSRTATVGKFRGGLADNTEETVKLHTAHHLLLAALQKVLSNKVKQRGSNITGERLRIDFSFDRKLTDEEKQRIEKQVNEWIQQDLQVTRREMKREEAEALGAEMEFGQKYPDVVSVYFIEDADGNAISKEFCGGPHVENIGVLGAFKIKSEKASSAGVRRIKATLQ